MKNIILICAAGLSTSLLVNKMRAAAEEKNLDVHIQAMPAGSFASYKEHTDVLLVGPQISYMADDIKNKYEPQGIKVAVIDMMDYGMMNGQKVLEKAYKMMEEN